MGPEQPRGASVLGEQLETIGPDALDIPQAKAGIDHWHQQFAPRLPKAERLQHFGD